MIVRSYNNRGEIQCGTWPAEGLTGRAQPKLLTVTHNVLLEHRFGNNSTHTQPIHLLLCANRPPIFLVKGKITLGWFDEVLTELLSTMIQTRSFVFCVLLFQGSLDFSQRMKISVSMYLLQNSYWTSDEYLVPVRCVAVAGMFLHTHL